MSTLRLLAAAFIITVLYATIYTAVQQDLRVGANDPQIQLAEDLASRWDNGAALVQPLVKVDVANSLANFIIVYDKQGLALTSSATLNGQTPALPNGVLQSTQPGRESRFTWQPQPGVRLAAVTVAAKNGYVLAGRSLREVEKREDRLTQMVAAAWALSILALLTAFGPRIKD